MKNYLLLISLFLSFILSGSSCGSMIQDNAAYQNRSILSSNKEAKFSIISKPEGAIIEINNEYLGTAPIELSSNISAVKQICDSSCSTDDCLKKAFVKITATPKEKGFVQTKYVSCYQIYSGAKFFFDTTLEQVEPTQKYDIKIDKQ